MTHQLISSALIACTRVYQSNWCKETGTIYQIKTRHWETQMYHPCIILHIHIYMYVAWNEMQKQNVRESKHTSVSLWLLMELCQVFGVSKDWSSLICFHNSILNIVNYNYSLFQSDFLNVLLRLRSQLWILKFYVLLQ